MGIISDLASGSVGSLLESAGKFAKDVRTAITGKEPISDETRLKLQQMANDIESQAMKADSDLELGQMKINEIAARN